jgi:hypothetical protein
LKTQPHERTLTINVLGARAETDLTTYAHALVIIEGHSAVAASAS